MSTPERPPGPLERALGVTFRDPGLLTLALTHRSYVHEHPDEGTATNERLEFLGDAIFQFLVAELLFDRFPEAPEGQLTAWRAALVSTQSFASIGEELGLADVVRVSRGEAAMDGRGRQSILAGCVEAIIAAVYEDSGLTTCRALVKRLIVPRLDSARCEVVAVNVKGKLQELVQGERNITPHYRVVARSGPVHAERFVVEAVAGDEVLGRGEGIGKRQAEQEAARDALEALGASNTLEALATHPDQTEETKRSTAPPRARGRASRASRALHEAES